MSIILGTAAAAAGASSMLAYIDTAVGVATFLISKGLPATIKNIRDFFTRKESPKPPEFNEEESIEFIQFLVINKETLQVISDLIKKAIQNYNECLSKATKPQESDACDRRAEKAICDSLNRIMDRNNNILPSKFLENQWISFSCVRF